MTVQDRTSTVELDLTRKRLRIVAVLFALLFTSLAIRLVDMARAYDAPATAEDSPLPRDAEVRRADIVDRHGALLATNIATLSVSADPARIADHDRVADALAMALDGVDADEIRDRLARGGRFAWIKRRISPREQAAVLDLGLPGVRFELSERRVYPNHGLASHVLGFVDIDNHGLAGIEYGMQRRLSSVSRDGEQALAVSIDLRIQRSVRSALARALQEHNASGACGIVLDHRTREILALVSLPDFDPNRAERAPAKARRNRCTGSVYELGSLFKVLTTGMALETGRVSVHDSFDASEPLRIGRYRVRDFHGKKRVMSVPEIFAFSSNIGAARMAFEVGGAEEEKRFLQSLGLFEEAVLEIPETEKPLLPGRWGDATTATVAFGHGIAVSPLQFVEAATAVLGDGRVVPSSLLRRDGPPTDTLGKRVVSPATIGEMRWLSWLAVERGTGSLAKAVGYLVGGKTGTADKPFEDRAGYREDAVVASFIGVFPIHDPAYTVLVMLDEPQQRDANGEAHVGGAAAAPVFAEIVSQMGPLLQVPIADPEVEIALQSRLQTRTTWNGRLRREEQGFEAVEFVQ